MFFLFSPEKALIFHANCLLRQLARSAKAYLLEKIQKHISKCRLLKFLPSNLRIKKLLKENVENLEHLQRC